MIKWYADPGIAEAYARVSVPPDFLEGLRALDLPRKTWSQENGILTFSFGRGKNPERLLITIVGGAGFFLDAHELVRELAKRGIRA